MKDLKDYREKELPLYIIANVLLFLVVHSFITVDTNNFPKTTEVLAQVFVSGILSAIAFGFIIVTECLFTSNFKNNLLYLFGLFNLPGCTIFSKIKDKDSDNRFSYRKVAEKYPTLYENLPTEKKVRLRYENEKWYVIYNQIREVPMIHVSQRDWLLCRDIYISTLVMLGMYIVVTVLGFAEFNCNYLLFLIVMLAITNFGTNRKAARFAYNVIAYDINRFPEKEKK